MSLDVEDVYKLSRFNLANGLRAFFMSSGKKVIIKVVNYESIGVYDNQEIYNLAFGDYILDNNTIDDMNSTGNNDGRKVFNTILSTIPEFFKHYPDKMLIVRGSDSRPEFIERCNMTCKKKCGQSCRKFNQRIRIYRNYVNLNYDKLNIEYQFFGDIKGTEDLEHKEEYVKGREYISILLMKRNL